MGHKLCHKRRLLQQLELPGELLVLVCEEANTHILLLLQIKLVMTMNLPPLTNGLWTSATNWP
jgi:hypothetical protein